MQSTNKISLNDVKKEISNIINNLNSTTCCFLSESVQNFPWHSTEQNIYTALKINLRSEIEKAILRGYETFICGLSQSYDICCSEIVLELKKQYSNNKLIGTLSHKNQHYEWAKQKNSQYQKILKQLDEIRCIYENATGIKCILERNRYMVNNSSLVIAFFNESSEILEYARKQGLEIKLIKTYIGEKTNENFDRLGRKN